MKLITETKLYVEVDDMSQAQAALAAVRQEAAGRRVHIRLSKEALARLHGVMATAGVPQQNRRITG